MANEYINRDAVIELLVEKQRAICPYGRLGRRIEAYIDKVQSIPTADVVERKRGEWIYSELDNFRKYSVTCPFCRIEYTDNYDGYVDVGAFNFCPNCGEDMRGTDNDDC